MPTNTKEYNQAYYNKNRKDILHRLSQKIECQECGSMVSRSHLLQHKRTKLHKKRSQNRTVSIEQYNKLLARLKQQEANE